jgi:hypothetical protein
MVRIADAKMRSAEVAARLGISGADVYRLLFAGELRGAPSVDGIVYFSRQSVDAYLTRAGIADTSSGSD